VVDMLGNYSPEECQEKFRAFYRNSFTLRDAQIENIETLPEYKNITFSGRYGAWNREYKIEKVIEEAIKYGQ